MLVTQEKSQPALVIDYKLFSVSLTITGIQKVNSLENFINNVNSSLKKKNGINTDWLQIKEVLSESLPGEKKKGKKNTKTRCSSQS